MSPIKGLQNAHAAYKYIDWMMYPLLRKFFPNTVNRLQEVGQAMINAVMSGYQTNILHPGDITALAKER
jgi:hypothetical protein